MTKIKKLSLQRESLTPLTASELDDVHGGTWTAVARTIVPVTKWLTRNACPSVAIELTTKLLPGGNKDK
jgi:hypothetical protein